MVGGLYERAENAWAHLYYPQRIAEVCAGYRLGHDVLRIYIYVAEDGYGPSAVGISP